MIDGFSLSLFCVCDDQKLVGVEEKRLCVVDRLKTNPKSKIDYRHIVDGGYKIVELQS